MLGELEEADILLAVVSPLAEVVPGPATMPVVHLVADGIEGEAEQRARSIGGEVLVRRPQGLVLGLAGVEVEEVDHGEGVSVLILVKNEAELVET